MKKKFVIEMVLITALLLSACTFPLFAQQAEEPTPSSDFMTTAVAGTVQAMSLQQPTMTVPPPAAEPTMTLPVQPTDTVSALPQPTLAPVKACNEATFVSETIPDDTKVNLNEFFTKTWTFMNSGTCTWNTNYRLAFTSGDIMGAPAEVYLTTEVAPGNQITVSVPMQASYLEGTYTGYWALQDDYGQNFFTNNSVKIDVTSDAFRVTGVTTDLIDRNPSCPYDYYYSISISTSSAGTVKYQLSDKAGNAYSVKSLVFDSADTKEVDVSWLNIGSSGSYWVKVYIQVPNNQTFGPFKFDITCK